MTEQFSDYHFPVGETIEISDVEEGEQEKDSDEEEKKELFREELVRTKSTAPTFLDESRSSVLSLLIVHSEVHTPPPKC